MKLHIVKAACIALLVATPLVVGATLAFAQDPPAVSDVDLLTTAPAPSPVVTVRTGEDFSGAAFTIRDTINTTAAAVILALLAWISKSVTGWIGFKVQLDDVARDLRMEEYTRMVIDKAWTYGVNQVGGDLTNVDLKVGALKWAAHFINGQFPEVWKWIDKDRDGVIDYIQGHLPGNVIPSDALAPKIAPAPPRQPT